MSESVAAPTEAVKVPFLDLGRVHAPLKEALLADIGDLIDSGAFTNGPQVADFERQFAAYCDRERCLGLASGLDALRLGLIAAGIESGDEVIVPANTFIATVEAITQAGGWPVLVDASEADYNVDVAACDAAVTERTRFLLPVDLYGQVADIRALRAIVDRYGLQLIEDACQAHGASRDGIRAGSGGVAAAFSFYPAKNLGAMGDAGALVTDTHELADRVARLREHGQRTKYVHEEVGWTARLDTIQAIVLSHKLALLDDANNDRRRVAALYDEALEGVGDLILPGVPAGSEPVWHLFVVRTGDPAALAQHLARRRIGTGRHYPEPVHLSAAYRSLGHRAGEFPVAEQLARESLSLPIFPGMTEAEVALVADAIVEYFSG
jgi:dTDP-4-amino-4,6-dideoxygalactose transaminase